ncbi:hypothetical protein OGR47_15460 [Methylocystis sp. MJC1]|jgi:hypothetical protein|uniref:hypothetical protein n=1 Tax=Methylocystis sp. MJC1 TaxID=2654282 RepID=UPI0013EB5533|nr:hypothetical protein [Methylocystis sp. MJC1]MBU6528356.1 hypothetical protein [Methylocystis sp. MJC1]UZX11261.1 hypothetical protein OGR47_15460 [Methylocystis sp. MJC1]
MIEGNLEAAKHEPSDVTGRFILVSFVSVAASIALLAMIVLGLFPGSSADQRMRTPLPNYPQPRVQLNPRADLQSFYRNEALEGNGPGQIPIEQAMRETAEEKIANWPGAPIAAAKPTAQPSPPESSHVAVRKTPRDVGFAPGNRGHGALHGTAGRHRVLGKARRATPTR